MLVMPVVSANFKPMNKRTHFCASTYTIGAEAEKVIRGMVNTPRVETRGLLTALLDFLRGDMFLAMTKDAKACLVRNITTASPETALCLPTTNGQIKIPTINSIKIDCQITANSGEIKSVIQKIEKNPDVCFEGNQFVQSDRKAAEELFRSIAKPV